MTKDSSRILAIPLPEGYIWHQGKDGEAIFDNKAIIKRLDRPDLTCHIAVRAKVESIPPKEEGQPGATRIYDPNDEELKAAAEQGIADLKGHI